MWKICTKPIVLTLIPIWICNDIHYKVPDEITYPFSNINGAAFKVWDMSNLILHFTDHMITYQLLPVSAINSWIFLHCIYHCTRKRQNCIYLMPRLKLIHVSETGRWLYLVWLRKHPMNNRSWWRHGMESLSIVLVFCLGRRRGPIGLSFERFRD